MVLGVEGSVDSCGLQQRSFGTSTPVAKAVAASSVFLGPLSATPWNQTLGPSLL